MKAIQYTAYGNSSVIKLSDVPKPEIKDDEVLIKVMAITVNPFEIKVRNGQVQKMMPVEFPFIPGSDAVGVVEAIGNAVTHIKVGDRVFTAGASGTYAQYAKAQESRVALQPGNLSPKEAVALAVPMGTSYAVLIEKGNLQKGQRILIHGAAGAVGSTMVQMAKALGAYVIGTASGRGLGQLKELGADETIDYKTQDFTKLVKQVDLVADLVGGDTQTRSFEVLRDGGKLVSIVMPPNQELADRYKVTAQFVSSNTTSEKLNFGKKLVEEGKIKPQITKVMKLEQAAEAQDLLTKGGINGKIVLEVS